MVRSNLSPRLERFNHLLEAVGFENAPFAWHVSKLPIDVQEFTSLLTKEQQ